MIIKRQYLDYEKSNGFIMTKVLNPSYANDTIPFDVFEAVHNPGESGALFIPTRVMVTRNQGQTSLRMLTTRSRSTCLKPYTIQ